MRPQKRVFIGLLVLTCLILSLVAFFLWYVPMVGFGNIHPTLPIIFTVLLAAAVVVDVSGWVAHRPHPPTREGHPFFAQTPRRGQRDVPVHDPDGKGSWDSREKGCSSLSSR